MGDDAGEIVHSSGIPAATLRVTALAVRESCTAIFDRDLICGGPRDAFEEANDARDLHSKFAPQQRLRNAKAAFACTTYK